MISPDKTRAALTLTHAEHARVKAIADAADRPVSYVLAMLVREALEARAMRTVPVIRAEPAEVPDAR